MPRLRLAALLLIGCGGRLDSTAVDAGRQASVRLVDETLSASCMPGTTPTESTWGSVTLEYVAGDSAAELDVLAVRYLVGGDVRSGVLTPSLSPAGSGLLVPGQDLVVEHAAVFGATWAESACGYCQTFQVEVDVAGPSGLVTLTSPTRTYVCTE